MKIIPIKRALLSVSDKTNIIWLAKKLLAHQIEIISTGGTSRLLEAENIPHQPVEAITGMVEMMDGRVKTLHPNIHAGILGERDKHAAEKTKHQIEWIDLVVVNFYPFQEAAQKNHLPLQDAIEYIDIGGPTMVRAAAKNCAWVAVITDPLDYEKLVSQLTEQQGTDASFRQRLAQKAFALTANYDRMIADYFLASAHQEKQTLFPDEIQLSFIKQTELRYGENPHQRAAAYQLINAKNTGILAANQLQGKPLSYNNIVDAEAALSALQEFMQPAAIIVKHAQPCGASESDDINHAFEAAYHADALSAFGGILALNRTCTKYIAEKLASVFMEVIIAPDFDQDAFMLFQQKPNLRLLQLQTMSQDAIEMKFLHGGLLLQERDQHQLVFDHMRLVTQQTTDIDQNTLLFAWRILKHIKSNAIVIAKNNTTVGIGGGLVSRIDAVDLAIKKAGNQLENAILASDAFFPFRDSIDRIAAAGIKTIIQPGGSLRDEEVINACQEHQIAMFFTDMRCFKH